MRLSVYQIGRCCVGSNLSSVFATGDHRGNRGAPKTPGKGPLRHRDTVGYFGGPYAFHFLQVALQLFGIQGGAVVVRQKGGAGFVFTGQESTCQRYASEDAKLSFLSMGEVILFRTPVEAVINYLQYLGANAARLFGLGYAPLSQNRNAQVADLAGALLLIEHRPQFVVAEGIVRSRMKLV